jgi:hypothetical protein
MVVTTTILDVDHSTFLLNGMEQKNVFFNLHVFSYLKLFYGIFFVMNV